MNPKKFCGLLIFFILMLLLGSGCRASNTIIPSQMPEGTIQPSDTAQIDNRETETTIVPVQTIPPTKTNIAPTTSENQLFPSPTLGNILTIDQEKEYLQRLLLDNGTCDLPCMWGITPGITSLDELNTILLPFYDVAISSYFYVNRRSQQENGGVTFILWEDNIRVPITLSYYNKKATVEYIALMFEAGLQEGAGVNLSIKAVFGEPFFKQTLGYYSLSNILREYGVPTEVLIAPFPDDFQYPPNSIIPFSIVLYYKTRGIFLEYISPKVKDGQYFLGCPAKSGYLSVIVWDPRQSVSEVEIASKASGVGINSTNIDYFQPLENVTNMTPEEFYNIFNDSNNTTCIETSIDIWK